MNFFRLKEIAQFLGGLLFIILLWHYAIIYFEIPFFILPTPYDVFVALIDGFLKNEFLVHTWVTLFEALVGFIIGSSMGIIFGAMISQFRILQRTILPYIVAFQALPKVALAPVFVIWFGFGLHTKIIMVAMLTFFPVLVNSIIGFSSASSGMIDLMRSLSANEWQIFYKLKIQCALPLIFSGIHIAIIQSILGAVVAEFVSAEKGLGVINLKMVFDFDIAGAFATLVVLALMATSLYVVVNIIKNKVIFWIHRT